MFNFIGDEMYNNNSEKYMELQYALDKHINYFESCVMHRLHHTEQYLPKKLIIKNYIPNCGHILPSTTQFDSKL